MPDVAILCGGKGIRLREVVSDRPKPMADVGGRPFLELLIVMLMRRGFRRIVLCVGFGAEIITSYFGNWGHDEVDLIFSKENEPAGTAGALAHASNRFKSDRVLVLNGDTFCDVDYLRMLQVDAAPPGAVVLGVVKMRDCVDYGSVEIGRDGRIVSFVEKGLSKSGWVNVGAYVFPLSVLKSLPKRRPLSLENDVLPQLAARNMLWAHKITAAFLDIGTPERYKKAKGLLSSVFSKCETARTDADK